MFVGFQGVPQGRAHGSLLSQKHVQLVIVVVVVAVVVVFVVVVIVVVAAAVVVVIVLRLNHLAYCSLLS